MKHLLSHRALHPVWALMTSLSSGVSTYLILLTLSHFYGLAAAGQFRLLLSIVAMMSLAALPDTGKILVKYMVLGTKGLVRPLAFMRFRWGLLGSLAGLVTAAVFYREGNDLWLPLIAASVFLPLMWAAQLVGPINQANRHFGLNAFYSVSKYGTLVVVALVLSYLQSDIAIFLALYFALSAGFHTWFLLLQPEAHEAPLSEPKPYVVQSIKLSASGLFQILCEHADKFLISYFFGVETLGLYTIGVSTGKLLLNFVKPLLTLFYRQFVTHNLKPALVTVVFLVLTALGLLMAYLVKFYYIYVLPEQYMPAAKLSAIILAGLGIYAIGVISYYSAVLNRDSTIAIPALVNIITFFVMCVYWGAAVRYGGEHALLLFAASSPLRELINFFAIVILKRHMAVPATT